jgi:hypothetical protein
VESDRLAVSARELIIIVVAAMVLPVATAKLAVIRWRLGAFIHNIVLIWDCDGNIARALAIAVTYRFVTL